MARRQWLTVAVDLVEHADRALNHFEVRGYTVRPETRETGYPGTPTLVAKRNRGRATLIVEVQARIATAALLEWARFAKACSTETRVAVVLPSTAAREGTDENTLREAGIGVLLSSPAGLMELIGGRDLTIDVSLPELATMHPKMRRELGPIYEKFDRGAWQDGFADACQALESAARGYLREGTRAGRLTFRTSAGKAIAYSDRQVNRMTIGALVKAYGQIEVQTHDDLSILNALQRINPDRVGRVHHAATAAAQNRLRRNVGRHMWVVVEGLKPALHVK